MNSSRINRSVKETIRALEKENRHLYNDLQAARDEKKRLAEKYRDTISRLEEALTGRANEMDKLHKIIEAKGRELQMILDLSPEMIFHMDAHHRYLRVNRRFAKLYDRSERQMIGRTFEELGPAGKGEIISGIDEIVQTGDAIVDRKASLETPGGRIDIVIDKIPNKDMDGNVTGIIGFIQDISNLKQAEREKKALRERIARSEKIASVGTLAGGIAHDFNNILGAIQGYAELAELEVADSPKASGFVQQICRASDRARDLIEQILVFSRQSKPEKSAIDIRGTVEEALSLLRASLSGNLDIRLHIGELRSDIFADPTQIHQVVMNLCTNAAHAIGEGGGIIEVSLSAVELATAEVFHGEQIGPGAYTQLTVKDNGCGMDADTVSHIFDPYFTTKKIGMGTGMGLATVHGIVRDHGGLIKVSSSPGLGSSFHLYLPTIQNRPDAGKKGRDLPPADKLTIIFVDDEKPLVEIGEHMLELLGHRVYGFTNAQLALEAFQRNPDRYAMIITDMFMPNMTGEALARSVRKIRKDVGIVMCTGFREKLNLQMADKLAIQGLLHKPLTMQDLSGVVRSFLS